MNYFELMVEKGPEFTARVLADCKISAMTKVCEHFGVPFEMSEEARKKSYEEHLEFLMREVGSK